MIAARGAGHGREPARSSSTPTRTSRRTRAARSAATSISSAGPQRPQRPRPSAKQALLGLAATQPRRSRRAALRSARASCRAAASPSPTAQLIGDKLFNVQMAARDAQPRAVARRSRSRQYKLVGDRARRASTSRTRSRASSPMSRTSACPGCCTPASCGRAARARTARDARASSRVDESSIKHLASGAGRAQQRLPRRRGAAGVRGDPGGGAAQGEVGRPADSFEQREHVQGDARPRQRGTDAGARSASTPATSTTRCGAAAKMLSATYKYQYQTATCRSGRRARSRTCGADGALISPTRRTRTRCARNAAAAARPAAEQDPRRQYVEGSSAFGTGPLGTTAVSQAAALTSQLAGAAGPAPVHALGRARLGQLRPGQLMADMRGGVDAATGRSSRSTTRASSPPGITQTADNPVRQHVRAADRRRSGPAALDTTNVGSTQYDMIRTAGSSAKSLPLGRPLLQDVDAAGAGRPAVLLRVEQFIDELAYAASMDPSSSGSQNISTTDQNKWRDVLVRRPSCRELEAARRHSVTQTGDVARAAASRSRLARRLAGRSRHRRHRGERQDRQDHREAAYSAQVAGLTVYLERHREPDDRQPRHGRRAGRCSRQIGFNQKRQYEPRLGDVSDPPLQGLAER